MINKPFILMGGYPYYPLGGFADYRGEYATLEEAQAVADDHIDREEWSSGWWAWANIGEITANGFVRFWKRDWGEQWDWLVHDGLD